MLNWPRATLFQWLFNGFGGLLALSPRGLGGFTWLRHVGRPTEFGTAQHQTEQQVEGGSTSYEPL